MSETTDTATLDPVAAEVPAETPERNGNGHAPFGIDPATMDPVFAEVPQTPGRVKVAKPVIFFGIPTAGSVDTMILPGVIQPSRNVVYPSPTLGQPGMYNALWCQALNCRQELGLTHYASMHSDVAAPPYWMDALLHEMDKYDADIVSACIPIKDERGLSSTAVRCHGTRFIRRITIKELQELPETFCLKDIPWADPNEDGLLLNNGLYICRFTEDWPEEWALSHRGGHGCGFRFTEFNFKRPDGKIVSTFFSEDWDFSEWCTVKGLRLYATRKIPVVHCGRKQFHSEQVGAWDVDQGDQKQV